MTYLTNAWYAAGRASDLGKALVGRTFLDLPVLLYRDAGGKAVATGDRCPHRFAPLHRGRGVHLITPETAASTHYFYAAVRNYRLDDRAADDASLAWQKTVFEERDARCSKRCGRSWAQAISRACIPCSARTMRIRSTMRRLIEGEERITAYGS